MKKHTPKAIFLLFLCAVQYSLAQKHEFSSLLIPVELKENANAVIRDQSTVIDVHSVGNMVVKVDRVITVLNQLGNSSVGAYVHYDNNSKISRLSAKIYDVLGNEIKKQNKNDFIDVSAVDGSTLYSDSRIKYLSYTPTSYPYTVHLKYEYQTSSTGFLQNWNPIEGYLTSVVKNSFLVKLHGGKARVKEKNFEGFKIKKEINDAKIYYEINKVPAFKNESLSPSLNDYIPKSLIALNNFKTDGVKGFYTNWLEFGLWMNNSLLNGRDDVGEKTKTKILELTKDIEDPIEKAKIVYQFMQEKTRYISVQVGIGGIQPISANEVDEVGYGDCKGLTNYTKSLLDIAGVTAYYSHVEANSNEHISFDENFASLEQGNHVILNLPNENGDDIWLECTSQVAPFGFLGSFTDDRNVLVMTPEGGKIKRTSSYKNEQNLQKSKATIKLDEKGNVTGEIVIKSYGIQYDSKYTLESYEEKKVENYYKSNLWSYNNNLWIENVDFKNDKDIVEFTENLKILIKEYTTESSGKMLFRVNIFNVNGNSPKRYRNRKLPLRIRRGYKDVDEFEIELSPTLKLDGALFQDIKIENKFGMYTASIKKISENKLLYKRTLLINEGLYSKENYKVYRSFRRKVAKYDNIRVALIKK